MDYPATYYAATRTLDRTWPTLSGEVSGEVCVIGGGYAGLMTALGLTERGCTDVVLIEGNRVGWGCSGRNGGFVFGGFSLSTRDLVRQVGRDQARHLYGLTTDAVALIRRRIENYGIDCSPTYDGVLWANWFKDQRVLLEEQAFLKDSLGVDWQYLTPQQTRELLRTERYHGALLEAKAFHFHPLNYALGIAEVVEKQGGRIYEQSAAVGVERMKSGYRVTTERGTVLAEQVVIAGGGYMAPFHKKITRTVLPVATYVMVTEPLGDRAREFIRTKAAVYDTRFAFDYYRLLPDTRLLWGGRISVATREPDTLKRLLKRDLAKVFPGLADVAVDFVWDGWMGYSRHKMPEIGQSSPGLWHLVGFGGHGVAPTTMGGELVAAAIAEGDDGYRAFSPWPLKWLGGPLIGRAAAQATYWWYEWKDWFKEWRE